MLECPYFIIKINFKPQVYNFHLFLHNKMSKKWFLLTCGEKSRHNFIGDILDGGDVLGDGVILGGGFVLSGGVILGSGKFEREVLH